MRKAERLAYTIAQAAITGAHVRDYPNGDYELACSECGGAGLAPGSTVGCMLTCRVCKGMGLVLVRAGRKPVGFDNLALGRKAGAQ